MGVINRNLKENFETASDLFSKPVIRVLNLRQGTGLLIGGTVPKKPCFPYCCIALMSSRGELLILRIHSFSATQQRNLITRSCIIELSSSSNDAINSPYNVLAV